jgi:D-alanine-D-alanine ligase
MGESAGDVALTMKALIGAVQQRAAEIDVTIVCNRRGTLSPTGDFVTHSLRTEFYSDVEFSQVIDGLRTQGLYLAGIVDESEFIRSASLGAPAAGRMRVLMNFGSARLGPWGKTLVPSLADATGWITTNSDAYAIALARHKFHCGAVLDALGISVARSWCYSRSTGWLGGAYPSNGTMVLVQPAFESASIGVGADSKRQVDNSLVEFCNGMAQTFRQEVIVREFVDGFEAEVPVVRLDRCHALTPIGISFDGQHRAGDRFLTYDQVLNDAYGFYPLADAVGDTAAENLMRISERAAEVLGLRGFCRIDYRIDDKGQSYVTDVSASPHFIEHSSFATATRLAGIEPLSLSALLIGLALRREGLL